MWWHHAVITGNLITLQMPAGSGGSIRQERRGGGCRWWRNEVPSPGLKCWCEQKCCRRGGSNILEKSSTGQQNSSAAEGSAIKQHSSKPCRCIHSKDGLLSIVITVYYPPVTVYIHVCLDFIFDRPPIHNHVSSLGHQVTGVALSRNPSPNPPVPQLVLTLVPSWMTWVRQTLWRILISSFLSLTNWK